MQLFFFFFFFPFKKQKQYNNYRGKNTIVTLNRRDSNVSQFTAVPLLVFPRKRETTSCKAAELQQGLNSVEIDQCELQCIARIKRVNAVVGCMDRE